METVSVSRRIRAPVEVVEDHILDVGPFLESSGFDRVTVDGDDLHIDNAVGLLSIELELAIVDYGEDVVLAYEQREGIFDEMTTWYELDDVDGECEVTCTTEFHMRGGPIGSVLDATVIKRQRRKEIEAQFDYLEARCERTEES